MISFHCASCQTKLTVKPEFAGRSSRCPRCKQLLTVPNPETTQAYVPPQPTGGEEMGPAGGATLEQDPAGRHPTPGQQPQRPEPGGESRSPAAGAA
jgi:hypothetical protein